MKVAIKNNRGNEVPSWDGEYPRIMQDRKNGDIILVRGYEYNAFCGTKIFCGIFNDPKASEGKWVITRLEPFDGEITITI